MCQILIITGMHRSGTSLLSNVALRAGIDMGSALMQGGRGNRRGHFEDLDFYHFHERFLERREVSAFTVPDGWSPDPSPKEDEEARALASSGRSLWGFKDPKTALFLDFWEERLASPLYLFVYRNPVEVALSLLRRGLELEIQQEPRAAIRAWMAYNERLLAFRAAHPDRCLLWHVAGATRSLDTAVGILEERLGTPLKREDSSALFHPDELSGLQAREIDWPHLLPAAFALYRRLEAAADLPGAHLESARPEPSRRERELLEANEHLLAAVLGMGPVGASTAALRSDFTRLRLLAAQQAEDNLGHEREKAELAERLRVLFAQRGEELRSHEEERAFLAEQLRLHEAERDNLAEQLRLHETERANLAEQLRLHETERDNLVEQLRLHETERANAAERLRLQEQETAMLAERLRRMEEDRLRLESTGAWRAVRSYWSTARRVQSWHRSFKQRVRRVLQGGGPPRPAADADPR